MLKRIWITKSVCVQSDTGDPFLQDVFCLFSSRLLTHNGHFCRVVGAVGHRSRTFVQIDISWLPLLWITLHPGCATLHVSDKEQMQQSSPPDCLFLLFDSAFPTPSTNGGGGGKKSLAYNHYKQKFSSHNDFPITHSQLTVWQHWPVYYSVGLYHVALPLIPWKAWKSQTTEMLISPKGKREEIKRQSCKK